MSRYKNLIAFDLSSYGCALTLINQFVDDDNVKVFEVSPSGTGAQLLLLGDEVQALRFIYAESYSLFKNQILSASVIENVHAELLPAYLSQNKTALQSGLLLLEGSSVAEGLSLADQLLKKNIALVDFRIVRTFPKNVLITFTADEHPSWASTQDNAGFRATWIDRVQPSLKSYFEIN